LTIVATLQELVEPETAGDPMTGQIWVRSSLRSLRDRLEAVGHPVSAPTVARLLKDLDYALHVNAKKREASSNHPDREQQFDYIAVQRATFTAAGLPILSIDSKKKELVGDFKNAGQAWVREPTVVNIHDFPSDADGRAVPYGVYDVTTNRGPDLPGQIRGHCRLRGRRHCYLVAHRRTGELCHQTRTPAAGRCGWQQ